MSPAPGSSPSARRAPLPHDGSLRHEGASDAGRASAPSGPIVNGAPWAGRPGATVADAVGAWCSSPRGVAVAVNGTVVPRSQWPVTELAAGDRVEIVTAAAGG